MKLRNALLPCLLLASPVLAQNFDGRWHSQVESPRGPVPFVFDLTVEDDQVSGVVENGFTGSNPISRGEVDDDGGIRFAVDMQGAPGGGGNFTVLYAGEIEGDQLRLVSTFEGDLPPGTPERQVFTAERK